MNEFEPYFFLSHEDKKKEEIEKIALSSVTQKVVLGFDIYKYSQYPKNEQIYVPIIFDSLYNETVVNILKYEKYFFSSYGEKETDFSKQFISTGDGGFQIFDNVLQAIVFAIYFQIGLKRYITNGSTGQFQKNLFKVVDFLELRSAITSGEVYLFKSNYYGPAIINNARILSKDSLNRFLVDSNSITWLNKNINAPENLLDINKEALSRTIYFKDYNKQLGTKLFATSGKILSADMQKIGTLKAKETNIDVFNIHIQAKIDLKVAHHRYTTYVITLGNLNTIGIND